METRAKRYIALGADLPAPQNRAEKHQNNSLSVSLRQHLTSPLQGINGAARPSLASMVLLLAHDQMAKQNAILFTKSARL